MFSQSGDIGDGDPDQMVTYLLQSKVWSEERVHMVYPNQVTLPFPLPTRTDLS